MVLLTALRRSSERILDVNCGPLAVNNLESIPNFANQSFMNIFSTVVTVVSVVVVALVSF